jgi:histidine triad (HIT) family protein
MATEGNDCIFCAIAKRTIPATIIMENNKVLAINDINPAAPKHVLLIPKTHIVSLNEITEQDAGVLGDMALMAKEIAQQLRFGKSGFRFVINTERGAGQSVFHLHAHVLAGRDFSWPPG